MDLKKDLEQEIYGKENIMKNSFFIDKLYKKKILYCYK